MTRFLARRAASGLAALALVSAAAACSSWDRDRREFVEPFNLFLHRRYPHALKSGDLERLLGFYSPRLAADAALRADKSALLGRFARIDHADDVIEDIEFLDGDRRVRARLFLRVRGETAASGRLSLERESELVCERDGGGFRIAAEKLLAERAVPHTGPAFTEEAEARGLAFTQRSGGVKDRWGRVQNYAAGAGPAAGDYDGDGFDDVYFASGLDCRLFRNQGDGTFEDVTAPSGASKPPAGEGRCGVFGDYDGDGRLDLFVGVLDAPDLLLRNNGDGTFADRAAAAGLRPSRETTGACFGDFNRDGHLDLYIISGGNLLRRDPDPMHNALNATPNALYINRGDGTFADRTREAGVGHTGWALSVAVQDYDLDGDTDIFIGNDVGFSVLYQNRGDATFEDVASSAGVFRRGTGMGASWGDPNGDGFPDIFVTGMFSNSRWIVDLPSYPAPAPWYVNLVLKRTVKDIVKEMFGGNWYYRNRGDGTFDEVAAVCGVQNSGWAWGGTFLDYDNDGREDIYVLNGFLSGPDPTDL